MGYIRHHAIVVTSWDENAINTAHEKADELFGEAVSDVVQSQWNGYRSFLIPPDGSNEGWTESDAGDIARERFKDFLRSKAFVHEDGSSPLAWIEIMYGDEAGEVGIVANARR